MKSFYIAFVFCAALPLFAHAQSLPDNPTQATPADPMWTQVLNLKPGTPIIVNDTYGPQVRCLFAEATAAYLDCNPAGNPPATGFRFNHIDVVSVQLDLPGQKTAQSARTQHNYHPAWFASMVIGGTLMGVGFAHTTDAAHAAEGGAISALLVGAVGAPFAFSPGQNFIPARPQFAVGIPFRMRFIRR